MDQDTHTMFCALIKALAVANSIEKFASSRDNVYGDVEAAIKRLGPEVAKAYEYWTETSEVLAWDDLTHEVRGFVND